jgi:hypothetical protein
MVNSIITLPRGHSEAEAAAILTKAGYPMCVRTLQRAREKQEITFRHVAGKVRYTVADLLAYIERGKKCAKVIDTDSRSEIIGLEKSKEAQAGTPSGGTNRPGELAVAASMNLSMRRQRSSSPNSR